MNSYGSIRDIKDRAVEIIPEYIELLKLLEEINPCGQAYVLQDDNLVISYRLKLL